MGSLEYVVVGSGVPIEKEDLVEFHLLYSGPLHSAGYERQRVEKHDIRRVFHGQLQRLWWTHRNLRRMAEMEGRMFYASEIAGVPNPPELPEEDAVQKGITGLGQKWSRNGFNFLPLVTRHFCLRCSLKILFLRVEDRDYVLQGGDIDGRLKILFDALRMTGNQSELPTGAKPEQGEDTFFCLLENDDLISEVHINTAQLLLLPGAKTIDKHDVYLQITVKLNPTTRNRSMVWAFE